MPVKKKRYPIFPVRLRPDDKEVMQKNVETYNLGALSDSIRVASRVMLMLNLSPEKIAKLNKQFEEAHPEALVIQVGPAS